MANDDANDGLEIAATVVLGLAAVFIALATYQSSLWGGIQDTFLTQSVRLTNEAASEAQFADTERATDERLFTELVLRLGDELGPTESDAEADAVFEAFFADDGPGIFIVGNMTAGGGEVVADWLDRLAEDPNSFSDYPFGEDYWEASYQPSNDLRAASQERFDRAATANSHSDDFELATTLLTVVLFFAGISIVLNSERVRRALIVLGAGILLGSTIYMFSLNWTS